MFRIRNTMNGADAMALPSEGLKKANAIAWNDRIALFFSQLDWFCWVGEPKRRGIIQPKWHNVCY